MERLISEVPTNMAPPTNGNPAPTKSAIFADHKKGKQKSIPKMPANPIKIEAMFIKFLLFMLIVFPVMWAKEEGWRTLQPPTFLF